LAATDDDDIRICAKFHTEIYIGLKRKSFYGTYLIQ